MSSIRCNDLHLKISLRTIARALRFDSYSSFINCARVSPSILKFDENKVKIAASGQVAIGIAIGLVTDCSVVKPALSGHPRFPYLARSITISGFEQEMRREMSVWGEVIGFDTIPGSFSPMGLKFSSGGENKGSAGGGSGIVVQFVSRILGLDYFLGYISNPSTPQRPKSRYIKTVSSPVKGRSGTITFPFQKTFEEDSKLLFFLSVDIVLTSSILVPLFDGRSPDGKTPGFSFTPGDFDNMRNLPRYVEGGALKDLPAESVVALGYTLGTYKSRAGDAHYLSTNLMFAILLSIPVANA